MSAVDLDYAALGGPDVPDPDDLAAVLGELRLHSGRLLVQPRVVLPPAPAAGAELAISVPSGVVWFVQTIRLTFVTSAAVATRVIALALDDQTTQFARLPLNSTQAAGGTSINTWARGIGYGAISNLSFQIAGLPNVPLVGGMRIVSVSQNLDAGDQYSAISLYVLEARYRQPAERLAHAANLARGETPDNYPGLTLAL